MTQHGDRIELISTTDPWTNLTPGAQGTVTSVATHTSQVGQDVIHVDWDDGSRLSLLADEDQYKVIPPANRDGAIVEGGGERSG